MKELFNNIESHIADFDRCNLVGNGSDPVIRIKVDYQDITLDLTLEKVNDDFFIRMLYEKDTYEWDDYYRNEMESYCSSLMSDVSLEFIAFDENNENFMEGSEEVGRDEAYEYGISYLEKCDGASVHDRLITILDSFENVPEYFIGINTPIEQIKL